MLLGEHQHLVDGQREPDGFHAIGRKVAAQLDAVDSSADVFAEFFHGDAGIAIDTSCLVVGHPGITTIPARYAQRYSHLDSKDLPWTTADMVER